MKKKILTITVTLVLFIGLVAAMGMNASAAGVPTALNRSPVVYTADNLWNYVAQSYNGDVIILGQDITYDDKNDGEEYVLPFGSQSDMVLDLNGHTLDITTRADALIELDYGATRLHIINSKPQTLAKIIMRTKRGDASIVDLSNKNCSLFVYDGVELAMGEKGDQAEAYRQTSVIKATAFSDIALYGATVTNNIANGCGIKFESHSSIDFDQSTVTLHGGAVINAETSCIYLSDSYDYPTFKIGSAHLNCDQEYYAAIFNYNPASSATAQVKALTFGDILFSSKYAAYNATAGGRLDNNGISNSQKLIEFKTKCDITFKLQGVLTECYHASTKSLLNSFCGHYTVCSACYSLMEIEAHTREVASVTAATENTNGEIVYANCDCGFKAPTTVFSKIASIKLSSSTVTYNGKVRNPSITIKDANGKALVEGTDYDVTVPSGRKNPGIYKYVVTFKGNYEGTKTLNFTINPKTVDVATIKATQSTSVIKLTWDAVEGATGYRVYQYSPSKGKFVQIASVKGVTSYRKATNLKAGTEYKFKVKAYTKLSDGTVLWATASKEFLTATECKAPSITSVTSPSKSKATVKWSNVDGETGFQLYYSTKKDSGYKKVVSYEANKLAGSKTFSSSASGKTIYFKVRAYQKVNGQTIFSEWSTVKSVKLK